MKKLEGHDQIFFDIRCILWAKVAFMTMLSPDHQTDQIGYLSSLCGLLLSYRKTFKVNNCDEMKEADLTIAQIRAEFETLSVESRSSASTAFKGFLVDPITPQFVKEMFLQIIDDEIDPRRAVRKPYLRVVK